MLHLFPHAVRPTLAESPLWRDPMSDEAYAIRKGLTDAEKGKTMTRMPRMHDDMNTVTGSRGGAGGGGGDASHAPLPLQPAHTQAYAPHHTQGTSSFQYSTEPYRANPVPPVSTSVSMSMSPYAHDGAGAVGSRNQGQSQGQQPYRGPIPGAAAPPYTHSNTHPSVPLPRSYVEAKSPYGNITTATPGYNTMQIQSKNDTRSSSSVSDTEMKKDKDKEVGDPLQYMS